MCGIVGVFAPMANAKWRAQTFKRMLALAQDRGTDATGYAYVENEEMVIVKDGVSATKFIHQSPEFLALMENAKKNDTFPNLIIGHARGATRGTNTGPEKNDNNHPFYSEKTGIAMIHNGLISNDDDWRKTVGKELGLLAPPESEVDSEVFLKAVETFMLRHEGDPDRGVTEAIDDACYCIAGSYTLAFLSKHEPNSFWTVKHKNPLHYAWVPSHKAVLFASTAEMIEKALTHDKCHLDFFVESTQTPAIVNTIVEDRLVKVTFTGKAKNEFDFDTTELDCATPPGRIASDIKKQEAKTETEGTEGDDAIMVDY